MRESDAALLATAEERISKEFRGQPKVAIELRLAIADAYLNRGQMDRAGATLRQAIDEGRDVLPRHDESLAEARIKAAQWMISGPDALAELELAIETAELMGERGQQLLARGLLNRSILRAFAGRPAEGLADGTRAYELALTKFGAGDPLTIEIATEVAWPGGGDVAEQFPMIEKAYRAGLANPSLGEGHPIVLSVQAVYAYHLARAGRIDEAMPLARSAIELARERHGDGRATEEVLAAAQQTFLAAGQPQAAYDAGREALRLAVRRHPEPGPSIGLHARLLLQTMILLRETREFDEVLALRRAANSAPLAVVSSDGLNAAKLLLDGRTVDAESMLEEAIARADALSGRRVIGSRTYWAWALCENGKPARALEILDEVIDDRSEALYRQPIFNQRAKALLLLGNPREAEISARGALAIAKATEASTPDQADSLLILGRALLQLDRPQEASEVLAEADAFWRKYKPGSAWAAETTYWHGRALTAAGEPDHGRRLVRQALRDLRESQMPSHRALAKAAMS
jgi:tetratricopeptide (TPR) repeat protein